MSAVGRRVGALSIVTALSAVLAFTASAAPAQAAIVNLDACTVTPLSQPFARWLDPAWYELVPGGDFENPAWSLARGAQRVAGSEPFAATGKVGSWSLSLPAEASAQSPPTCVDAAYPTIRFFTSGVGVVAVSVVYGNLTIPAGVAVATGGWAPSLPALTDSALIAAASDGSAPVSVRLTTLVGDVRVDDVFVDPWNRG
jgi:hypothetical protein